MGFSLLPGRACASLSVVALLAAGCLDAGTSGDPEERDGPQLADEAEAEAEAESAEGLDDAIGELAFGDNPSLMFDPRRSLIETNIALLAPLTMQSTLSLIATNGGLLSTPELTHNLLFNLYNDAANDVFPGLSLAIPHRTCDHPDYQNILNNYPYQCPRTAEGGMAVGSLVSAPAMSGWTGLALVNRLDLAPADGSHCGEQRLIVGRTSAPTRDFVIFEAQIPNPTPGDPCGCEPLAQFWDNLSNINSVATRQGELGLAFFFGHPTLAASGFGPFMAAQNFTIGTGQVRTNNFAQGPWTLRENKLIGWNGIMFPIPFPNAANPHAPLLADSSPDPRAPACKQDFLNTIPSLLTNDPNLMAVNVSHQCLDGDSPNNFNQANYDTHVSSGTSPVFFGQIQAALTAAGSSLTPDELARRATFAGSCIGCHQEQQGPFSQTLGQGVQAPASLGFVHVSEFGSEDCGDGTQCHPISNGLKNSFLPFRQGVMQGLINQCSGPSPLMAGPRFAAEGDAPQASGIDEVTSSSAAPPQVFMAEDAMLPDGSLDFPALAEIDAAAKTDSPSIGGVPASRVH